MEGRPPSEGALRRRSDGSGSGGAAGVGMRISLEYVWTDRDDNLVVGGADRIGRGDHWMAYFQYQAVRAGLAPGPNAPRSGGGAMDRGRGRGSWVSEPERVDRRAFRTRSVSRGRADV